MPEERTGYPADPPSTGASGGRAHPGCLPRLLSDGDAAASAADAGTWTDTAGSAGNTGRYSNAGRIFSDYRWPPTGHAALHRTESRSGAVAPSSEPRPAATTASAHHDPCLDSPLFPAQNVVETLAVPLLKIKRISALDMPNCEGSVMTLKSHATRASKTPGFGSVLMVRTLGVQVGRGSPETATPPPWFQSLGSPALWPFGAGSGPVSRDISARTAPCSSPHTPGH